MTMSKRNLSDQPKRTPGVWEARQRATSLLWGVYPVGLPPDETFDILDGNSEADYRLMAAAPELLAALERWFERADDCMEEPACGYCLWCAANAAITKARGEE